VSLHPIIVLGNNSVRKENLLQTYSTRFVSHEKKVGILLYPDILVLMVLPF
jgi:hypothetical protein